MSRAAVLALCFAAVSFQAAPRGAARDGAQQIIDNDRVTVVDTRWTADKPGPLAQYDSVVVYLEGVDKKGVAIFEAKGRTDHEAGVASGKTARAIMIDLKDHPAPPLRNTSGHRDAFDRAGIKTVLRTIESSSGTTRGPWACRPRCTSTAPMSWRCIWTTAP